MRDIKVAVNSPFRMSSSSQVLLPRAFYQSRERNILVVRRLARFAEECQARRDLAGLEQSSMALMGLGWEPARSIGKYYQALVVKGFERGDIAKSDRLLIDCSAGLPPEYRPRALMSHANSAGLVGSRDEAVRLFIEAWRAGMKNDFCDPKTVVGAARFLNYWRAADGGEQQALKNLYELLPMVRAAARIYPFLYYDHLDTMAYVAGMLGRWQEASQMSDVVMTAPMVSAYPNWQEHHAEFTRMAGRRRGSVIVGDWRYARAQHAKPAESECVASVTSIAEWKAARGRDQALSEPLENPSEDEKQRFLDLIIERGIDEAQAKAIFDAAPLSERKAAVINMVLGCEELIEPAMAILSGGSGLSV